jgi:hypothetical protein
MRHPHQRRHAPFLLGCLCSVFFVLLSAGLLVTTNYNNSFVNPLTLTSHLTRVPVDLLGLSVQSLSLVPRRSQETHAEVDSLPLVLLLHPDEGLPGYAQMPHLGSSIGVAEVKRPAWKSAAKQLAKRVTWDLGEPAVVEFKTMSLSEFCLYLQSNHQFRCTMIFGVDLGLPPSSDCAAALLEVVQDIPERLFITSSPEGQVDAFWQELISLSGASASQLENTGPFGLTAVFGGWSAAAKLGSNVKELWHRRTAEEAVYAVLLLIDAVVKPLTAMQEQKPVPSGESLGRAIERCQEEFRGCFSEPRCLQSLACLSTCGLADQSCSYRCIVSYQSQAFTDFSLCALQKQNLLNSQIQRPETPRVQPMQLFRGQPLTHETAEDILVGHYDPMKGHNHSWLVVAGSNPAYEQFALQYQLWYKGSAKNTFWYHPTFLVEALDGRKIWRSRDYRVRRKNVPGLWEFSVLDNGITSEEKWHLLGAADDLEWLVLFYVGAARKAGLSYRGCLLLTKDGQMPRASSAAAVTVAIAASGMELWELEETSNPPVDPSNPPPLIAPDTQQAAPLLQMA